jgi:hypothetical protein
MASRETLKSIRDILINQMGLTEGQVMMAYSKFDIPLNDQLYIALSYVSSKAVGSNSQWDPTLDPPQEIICMTLHEVIQIDVMSFGTDARTRKAEVAAALASVFSQQQQEMYNFNIGRIPGDFVNASSLEETKYLNRFTMNVQVTTPVTVTKNPAYFDTFGTPTFVVND